LGASANSLVRGQSGAIRQEREYYGDDRRQSIHLASRPLVRLALFAAAATLIAAACAAPATGPRVANNPCEDPAYRALKAQPVDSLSTREYEQMQAGDAACAEVTRLLAANANDRTSGPRQPVPGRETDSYTQAMTTGLGAEIFVRNRASFPIIVTSVTLLNCVGIADPCNTYNPRTRINPGDARRVLRVRYVTGGVASSYSYSYRVEAADQGSQD
jgi:hypothetical protein